MKALTITKKNTIDLISADKPTLKSGEVLIKIKAAALNKRDQFIREGKYPNIQLNTILGSDGAGEVVEVADKKNKKWISKHVIINPNINWGDSDFAQSRDYTILGMPVNGTLAEFTNVASDRLVELPKHLSVEEGAAFPLGGVTAFRACFHHGKIKANENVLISGFGGGVAQFAFQYALAAGANVFVTSSSKEKLNQALEAGASGAYNYKEKDWYKNAWQTKGGFDVVIDSAGGEQINTFIKVMKPAGRIVFYGATNGLPSSLDLYRMFWNQITLQGSTMGSDKDFKDMIKFISKHKIKPIIDSVRPFYEVISAFDDMANNKKTGKIVVKLTD